MLYRPAIIVLVVGLAVSVQAGLDPSYSKKAEIDTVPFYAGGQYDPTVPKPNDLLRYPIGQWPLRYGELVDYLEALGASSGKRVKIESHGQSYEGRALYNVFISSEENIANLEQLRLAMNRLAEPSENASAREIDSLARVLPAFAWMGYSIHGDELSGVDAATQLIYQLAAGTDSATMRLLENVVVIIDPTQNPDGRERYLAMIESYRSQVPNYNRFAMQHSGVWPYGRGNHYLFDLNRDWILVRNQETRSKLATILKWHPQLTVDGHEMGSNATFLFGPPGEPINYNTPSNYLKWAQVFGDDQAAAFDSHAWPYYIKEWAEQWYPGYGSAWSTFFGSIGILYEMASVDGQFVKQQDDYLLTYHEAVNKQFTSSLSNLTTLAGNRTPILRDYSQARRQIIEEGRRSKLSFLFKPDRDEIKMQRFVQCLLDQGIEVRRAGEAFTVASATDMYGKKVSSLSMPAGSYIVSTDQTQGALAKAALEPDPRLKYEFLKEERREIEKFEGSKMYEVSTWSLPLAYALDAYSTTSAAPVNAERVTEVTLSPGRLIESGAQFGFAIDMVGEKTDLALAALFQEDLVVYCSAKAFTLEGRSFSPGALVIRKRGNPDNLPQILEGIAHEVGIEIYGINTGRSEKGSYLGAETFQLLQKPRIGLVAGEGIGGGSFGTIWYTIDQELELPHSLLTLSQLGHTNLELYNVLIIPSSWGPLDAYAGDGARRTIREWVQNGGTLICMDNSAAWAADTSAGLSQVRLRHQVLDKLQDYDLSLTRERQAESPEVDTLALWYPEKVPVDTSKKEKPPSPSLEEAKRIDEWQRRFFPRGVIMRAELDTEDWLSFGLGKSLPVNLETDDAFLAKAPVKTVARLAPENELRISGLLWPEARARWANTAYATRESVGRGQIILFATHPNFRAYFYGSRQMLVNAILLGPGFGAGFEGPYEEGRR